MARRIIRDPPLAAQLHIVIMLGKLPVVSCLTRVFFRPTAPRNVGLVNLLVGINPLLRVLVCELLTIGFGDVRLEGLLDRELVVWVCVVTCWLDFCLPNDITCCVLFSLF